MKTTKGAIGVAVLVTFVASFMYSLGYQHGRSSSRATLNKPSDLRQVGLRYREDRNTVSRFALPADTGATTRLPHEK